MASELITQNLQLEKPSKYDYYDIETFNRNMDKIDVHTHTTVNGHTVNADVPSDAKFTDTVYTHPSTHPYSMLTGVPTSLPANGGNSTTVNGHTVNANVPSDAKFTDTVYTHPSSHPYSMITGTPSSLPANGGNADTVDNYHLTVVTALPSSPNANTIYFVKG